MLPLTRIKLSFLVLGMVYFSGGIEYAVSMPKGWLYWDHHTHLSRTALALFLSGYSITAFFSAPLMGRLVDRIGGSKRFLVVGGFLHLIGAVLDFVCPVPWLQVTARFLSGIGAGVDAVVLGEAIRHMLPRKMTPVLAILIGIRQLGLMLMPGVNYFLGGLDPEITRHFKMNDISGLLLIIVWGLVCTCTLLLYTDLSRLMYASLSAPHSHSNTPSHSRRGTPYNAHSGTQPIAVPSSSSQNDSSGIYQRLLGRSSEMIEETEKFIQHFAAGSYGSAEVIDTVSIGTMGEGVARIAPNGEGRQPRVVGEMSTSFNCSHESRKGSVTQTEAAHGQLSISTAMSSRNFDHNSYMMRNNVLPENLQRRSVMHAICREFIREDVVPVLMILTAGFFAQVSFQVLILPLTEDFIPGEELYSVILYCLAAFQLLMVLMGVWWCGHCVRDHHLMVIGAGALIASNIWLLAIRPHVSTADEEFDGNMVKVAVSVCLCVLGAPLLLVSGTSLLAKLTMPLSQGLSQGVYHSCLTLAAVLAALWTKSTLRWPYLQHGIIIGLLGFGLILVGCSYKNYARLQCRGAGPDQISRLRGAESTPHLSRASSSQGQLPPDRGSMEESTASTYHDTAEDVEHSVEEERDGEKQPLLS